MNTNWTPLAKEGSNEGAVSDDGDGVQGGNNCIGQSLALPVACLEKGMVEREGSWTFLCVKQTVFFVPLP